MSTVEEIKSAISSLSKEDYIHLRKWFSEKDWEQWDEEIKRDSSSGELDFLIKEAEMRKGAFQKNTVESKLYVRFLNT